MNPLYVLFALVAGYALGHYHDHVRRSAFLNHGEERISRLIQNHFFGRDFHLLNHITLKIKDGTTQIDHILVSRFGIFVIETKDYRGWIFANANHSTWTQVLFHGKYKFQNPVFQNMLHVQAVRDLLDFIPPELIQSLVVFTQRAEFKTDKPPGVFTESTIIEHLRGMTQEVISLNRVQFCVGRLETARLAISGETDLEHVARLKRRHGRRN